MNYAILTNIDSGEKNLIENGAYIGTAADNDIIIKTLSNTPLFYTVWADGTSRIKISKTK